MDVLVMFVLSVGFPALIVWLGVSRDWERTSNNMFDPSTPDYIQDSSKRDS